MASSSKIKVVILASEWGSKRSGLSTFNREFAIELAKHPMVQVSVYLLRCDRAEENAALKHNITLIQAKKRPGFDETQWLCFPPKDLQMDFVIGHGEVLGRQAQIISEYRQCKWIQFVHTDPEGRIAQKPFMFKDYPEAISKGALCAMADFVVAVGSKVAEAYRSYLRFCGKDQKVFVLTPGIFSEFLNVPQSKQEGSKCRVLAFGRGDADDFSSKEFDIAANAVAKLEDVHLIFVGTKQQDEEASRLKEYNIPPNRLRVRTFKELREHSKQLFTEVDLAIMPSRTDGFGLVALEAMSAGLPFLVSANSGFGEALEEVDFGSLFAIDSDDPEVWTDKIKRFCDKKWERRVQEPKVIRDNYAATYNWTEQCKDLVEMMRSILNGNDFFGSSDPFPSYVRARGKKAVEAYQRALKSGRIYDKRVKVLLVGQDRVGKTSLGKCLRGEPFDKDEPSTDGVQMIPAIKNAGKEAWKNPASLENTAVFDHKIAAKLAEEFLNTQYELKTKASTVHPTPSSEGKSEETAGNLSEEGRETTRQEDIQRNEKESDGKQTEPQREEKEDAMPAEVVPLLEELLQESKIDKDDKIWPIIWDFAGQDIYRAIHPIFMSSEDIYLLVFDLTKELSLTAECRVNQGDGEHAIPARESKDSNLDHMLRWMDLIHSLKNGGEKPASALSFPPVVAVGTHVDKLQEVDPSKKIELAERKWECVRKAFPEHFTAHINTFYPIDNTKAGRATGQEEITTLRTEILDLAHKMPHTMKEVPLQWHRLEKELGKPVWQGKEEPFLDKKAFREQIVSKFCKVDNEGDFDELLHFLHARGSIVYHEHLDETTSDKHGLVFLNPQWLIKALCQIIKVEPCKDDPVIIKKHRETLKLEGTLSKRLLDHGCRKLKLDSIEHSLLSLMKKFNLICEWSTTKPEDSLILVPCMLTTASEEGYTAGEMTSDCPEPVYLTFAGTNYVPGGLFSRLVVLFGKWLSDPQHTNEYKLYANEAQFALDENHLLQLLCYKTIIQLRISAAVGPPSSEHFRNVLSHLKEFLETLKEECHWLHSMTAKVCARCTFCSGKNIKPCIRHEEKECRHHDCAHYISFDSKLCCKPGCPLPQEPLKPWIQAFKHLEPVGISTVTEPKEVYKMTAKPRGVALIINNKTFNPLLSLPPRHGSEKDVKELQLLFNDLHFNVQTEHDLKKNQLWHTLTEVASADHSEYDCFVLCLMSHGKEGNTILCSGGGIVKIEEVLDMFTSVNCKTLEGKPKVVFIQACRGKDEDAATFIDEQPKKRFKVSTAHDPEAPPVMGAGNKQLAVKAHRNADFLIANSTASGHVSYRSDSKGSYFVNALVKVFREKFKNEHLYDMLAVVNDNVNEFNMHCKDKGGTRYTAKQTIEITSTLRKKLFF